MGIGPLEHPSTGEEEAMKKKRDCYERAFLALLTPPDGVPRDAILVHGYPRLTAADGDVPEGTQYGHAWIEFEVGGMRICYDAAKDAFCLAALYYVAGRIEDSQSHHYTKLQAMEQLVKYGHYGDWGKAPKGVVYHEG